MDTLYREEILEHYRDPQNFRVPKKFDVSSHQHNPFCGDDISVFVSGKDTIEEIWFHGSGCAISIAGGSILTDFSKGKLKNDLKKLSDESMIEMLGVPISETRKKCALLTLWTLRDCLDIVMLERSDSI